MPTNEKSNPDPFTSIFDEAHVISVYTDADALADGVLVDIHHLQVTFRGYPVDRVTDHFWGWMEQRWERFSDTADGPQPFNDLEAKLSLQTIVDHAWADDEDRAKNRLPRIYTISLRDEQKLWLVRNERKGWTLMFPEDY